jgi:hypothetical protein
MDMSDRLTRMLLKLYVQRKAEAASASGRLPCIGFLHRDLDAAGQDLRPQGTEGDRVLAAALSADSAFPRRDNSTMRAEMDGQRPNEGPGSGQGPCRDVIRG